MKISANFHRAEFACQCGCGFDTIDALTLRIVQDVRDQFGAIKITSGCRCKTHNRAVGGSSKSQHLKGRAADIVAGNATPKEVADYVAERWPQASIGRYPNFTHIDTRSKGPARWGSH